MKRVPIGRDEFHLIPLKTDNFNKMKKITNIWINTVLFFSLLSTSFLHAQDNAEVVIYPNQQKELRSGEFVKNRLDRSKYFTTMGTLTGTRYTDSKWEMMKPTRCLGPHLTAIDKNYKKKNLIEKKVKEVTLDRVKSFEEGFRSNQDFKWAIAGISKTYPSWMRESGDVYDAVKNNYFELAALQVNAWLDELESNNVPLPTWFTVQNEPKQSWNITDIGEFHRVMANSIQKKHKEVHVFGPCWAWTFPGKDLSDWQKFYADFIAATQNALSGYDLHTYSKGYWAYDSINYKGNRNDMTKKQNHPSLFKGMYNGNETVYDFGTLESQLNMLQAVQNTLYDVGPKPVIISEYGRQSITPQFGPWENDFKFFLYMTTVIRQMMLYMDVPEVQLAVPFILAHSDYGYAPNRGQAVYNLQNDPDNKNHTSTPFLQFYEYFKDVNGERLYFEEKTAQKTFSNYEVIRDGKFIYLLAHYGKTIGEFTLDLDVTIEGIDADDITATGIKRLKWEGEYPEPHNSENVSGKLIIDSNYQSLASLNDINISGEETIIVRIELNSDTEPSSKMVEEAYYAKGYLAKVQKNTPYEMKFSLKEASANALKCFVDIALAVDEGMNDSPEFTFNGEVLGKILDHRHTRGITKYNAVERVELPVSLLRQGENTLSIKFGEDVSDNDTYVVSAKLVVLTEE
ncbi:hypothetical protein [uncultured Draconibacterium sp.]|uniref:hypothetical protein n=1 Tax=uncultured Draconibacterium sp. TaxID=1573823 RepID=UPI0025F36832|nr:hypothetical protein [uncultured Draconibacterium sp.]